MFVVSVVVVGPGWTHEESTRLVADLSREEVYAAMDAAYMDVHRALPRGVNEDMVWLTGARPAKETVKLGR